jgi:FAD:protein FMN transferase
LVNTPILFTKEPFFEGKVLYAIFESKIIVMKKATVGYIFILFIFLFTACRNESLSVIDGFTQGTTYHVVYRTSPEYEPDVIRKGLENLFGKVDNSLSIYNDSSVISLINKNASCETDTLFREVFRLSYEVWKETGGAFDITVGPLVKAWGFGPDAIKNFDVARLPHLLSLVGMDKVRLNGGKLIKSSAEMYIDMNAVAQGFTVDLAIDYLKSLGITDCLVEVGGEVRSAGNKGGEGWIVGIDKPVDGNNDPGSDMEAVIQLNNMSLATSGNYRKFYIDNGVKYSHTIDPHTGYPARQTLLSATIVAPECAVADAYATACMVIGTEGAKDLIKKHKFLEGYLIWSDENGTLKTWASKRIRNKIRETDRNSQ